MPQSLCSAAREATALRSLHAAPGEQPPPEQPEPAHGSEDPGQSQGCSPYP